MNSARACAFKRFGGLDYSNPHFCFLRVGGHQLLFFCSCFLLAALCLLLAARPCSYFTCLSRGFCFFFSLLIPLFCAYGFVPDP
jgi:hypothetical protein